MPDSVKARQPEYYAKFRCIGSDCEDTCCAGSGVAIDKETYEKYRACPDPELKPLLDEKVQKNSESQSDQTYALVVLNGSVCPFLTEKRLCAIQQGLGEDYLSRACYTYPRAMSRVDGILERSLYLSCPEAARLVLLNPEGIKLAELEAEQDNRFHGFPELDSSDPAYPAKPYGQFIAVRAFTISLLQNRNYPIWKRLIILGMFCDELNKLPGLGRVEAVKGLISSFSEAIATHQFEDTLQNIPLQPALQVTFLIKSLEHRVSTDYTGPRFLECYKQFLEGIGYSAGVTTEQLAANYADIYQRYYAPFMADHEYLFENYLVNYAFKGLFPFGPQKSTYFEEKTFFTEFLTLTIHYALLRSLLVGMAGYHKERLQLDQVIVLFQSFAKAIEHSLPYLKSVRQSLEENNMANLSILAFLIKN
jgi:lysine-N-methylase